MEKKPTKCKWAVRKTYTYTYTIHLINVVFKLTTFICLLCIINILSMSIPPVKLICTNYELYFYFIFFSSTVYL